MSGMDDREAPLARQGDGAARHAASHLDSATVVIDPGLPQDMQAALTKAGTVLVPYQGPVPELQRPASSVGGCASVAGVFFVIALIGAVNGGGGLTYTMLIFAGIALLTAVFDRPGAKEIAAAQAPINLHRCYVLPSTDIDAEHWQLWKRAVDARNRIAGSEVVSAGSIDSVQVAEVLPQRLWHIAERLARLAEVRARHKEILGDISPEDPDVAPTVSRQRRAQELAVADVTRRVSELENFADLVDAADLATRKEATVRELNALDDTHAALLAGIGDTTVDADIASRLGDDVTAVIEQAREAIKQANEAALSLVPPGDEQDAEGTDET